MAAVAGVCEKECDRARGNVRATVGHRDSCNFGRCVRSNAAVFEPFAKGWKSQYSLIGPNSKTVIGHLARHVWRDVRRASAGTGVGQRVFEILRP
jgi:hypothetical protein